MAREIDLEQTSDARKALQTAAAELEAGHIVAITDECGWRLLGLPSHSGTASRLKRLSESLDAYRESICLGNKHAIEQFTDEVPSLFHKLTTRCWPGPVVVRLEEQHPPEAIADWPSESQAWGLTDSGRGFSMPACPFALDLLDACSEPALSLVFHDQQKLKTLPDGLVHLILRSELARYPELPTVIRIHDNDYQLEQPGVVNERMLKRLAGDIYLFVCTGNTCRSPMAEALFRKMLAERLQCREDELLDHGLAVISAGLAAHKGAPAAQEAVELLKRDGADLSSHESQPVTEDLLFCCDHIITMTKGHANSILATYPELNERVRTLSRHAQDVSDPIGGGVEEYSRCREQIVDYLHILLNEIDFSKK